MKLTMPFPPAELNPNRARGLRWWTLGQARKLYRETCGWEAKDQAKGVRLSPPVLATVTFVVPDHRRRDVDNLLAALKPCWDGLVDAGVLADDSHDKLRMGAPVVRVEKGQRYVEIELKEVHDEPSD